MMIIFVNKGMMIINKNMIITVDQRLIAKNDDHQQGDGHHCEQKDFFFIFITTPEGHVRVHIGES